MSAAPDGGAGPFSTAQLETCRGGAVLLDRETDIHGRTVRGR